MSVRKSVRIPSETCPAKRPKLSVRLVLRTTRQALSETLERISDAACTLRPWRPRVLAWIDAKAEVWSATVPRHERRA